MFNQTTPENAGIASKKVLEMLKMLDEYELHTHSVIISRGDNIIAEAYYKPFDRIFLHRMYSSSKTFIAMAIGVAVTEGLISLDDAVIDYFPEFRNENTDELYEECTVRDMLKMQSNIGTGVYWWGVFKSRPEAYYSMKTSKIPGTQFMYDSIGCFLLGCIIEKLTGKTFLEYLKEKVLLDIGFSKDSYTLYEPGGFTVGDSGVMCTARDLWLFARFIMKKGEWGGKQYIDRQFMEDAILMQAYNRNACGFNAHDARGYGYLIWRGLNNCFMLLGMGDQIAVCHPDSDVMMVMTADNQGDTSSRAIIMHEFCKRLLPEFSDIPLEPSDDEYLKLTEYLSTRSLVTIDGQKSSHWAEKVSGVKYYARENNLGILDLTLSLCDNEGTLSLTFKDKAAKFDFYIQKNKITKFSYGTRAKADMMGVYENGEYDAAISAAWVDENTFGVSAQIIDTYFGTANAYVTFKDERATLHLTRSGQYVFDGIEGYAVLEKK